MEEHITERREAADGRSKHVAGRCWHENGRHMEREPVLICKVPVHSHDMHCRSFCPFRTGEHLHGPECWEVFEQEAIDRCGCKGYDPRTPEEVARDDYRESRRCVWCGHDEQHHPGGEGEVRSCRFHPPNYPYGWKCHECQGYVPVAEFRLNPHDYMRTGPQAWSPQLEEQAKKLRDERAARDAEVERRLAARAKEDER